MFYLSIDNGHTCINDGAGNAFVLTHDTFADVQVDSFEQDITADNTCFFFQECTNVATNVLAITAQDATGATATNDDVTIGSKVQTIGQTNDCDGVAVPDPLCTDEATNAISISALVDGDVNLGDSEQAVTQLNNCDDGEVTCDNVGSNFLALIANGDDAEANLDTNAQTSRPNQRL